MLKVSGLQGTCLAWAPLYPSSHMEQVFLSTCWISANTRGQSAALALPVGKRPFRGPCESGGEEEGPAKSSSCHILDHGRPRPRTLPTPRLSVLMRERGEFKATDNPPASSHLLRGSAFLSPSGR